MGAALHEVAPFSLRGQRYAVPMTRFLPFFALCLLAACGGGDADKAPGSVTTDEAKALDDAAEMIGVQRLPGEPAVPVDIQSPGPSPSAAAPQ
jgi:hypothetical protein